MKKSKALFSGVHIVVCERVVDVYPEGFEVSKCDAGCGESIFYPEELPDDAAKICEPCAGWVTVSYGGRQ